MWQIIKAEYEDALITNFWKTFGVILMIIIFTTSFSDISIMIAYFFVGAIILSFRDEKRYYIYQILPVKPKKIALSRLIMIGINFTVLLLIIIPIMFVQENTTEYLLKIFPAVGIFIIIRLFSFSLFDITSGFCSRNKKLYLTLLLLFGIMILVAYSSILTIYFRKSEMLEIFILLSFFLIPLSSYISIKTFLSKDVITVKEEL